MSGDEKDNALATLRRLDLEWLGYLVDTRQYQRAKDALDAIPAADREPFAAEFASIELQIAAGLHTLDALLAADRSDPDHAPSLEALQGVARALDSRGDKISARKILEFAYERELDRRNLAATNFLGLAEIRLENGDERGALAILDRLVLVTGAPFENVDAAAWLLERHSSPADAAVYLAQLSQAEPWRADYRLRLARAEVASGKNVAAARKELIALAASPDAAYGVRAAAASALRDRASAADLGSGELALLAFGDPVNPSLANQPYFTIARIAAAPQTLAPRERIALLRATLEDAPWSESARLQIVHVAAAAREYQFAESAAAPLVNSQFFTDITIPQPQFDNALEGFPDSPNNADDSADDSADDATTNSSDNATADSAADQNSSRDAEQPEIDDSLHPRPAQENSSGDSVPATGEAPAPSSARTDPERLRLALDLTIIYENLDRLDSAVHYLQIAAQLQTHRGARAQLERRIVRLSAEIKRRADNAARRPVVRAPLEQDHLVRPEIPAPAGATPAGSAVSKPAAAKPPAPKSSASPSRPQPPSAVREDFARFFIPFTVPFTAPSSAPATSRPRTASPGESTTAERSEP